MKFSPPFPFFFYFDGYYVFHVCVAPVSLETIDTKKRKESRLFFFSRRILTGAQRRRHDTARALLIINERVGACVCCCLAAQHSSYLFIPFSNYREKEGEKGRERGPLRVLRAAQMLPEAEEEDLWSTVSLMYEIATHTDGMTSPTPTKKRQNSKSSLSPLLSFCIVNTQFNCVNSFHRFSTVTQTKSSTPFPVWNTQL